MQHARVHHTQTYVNTGVCIVHAVHMLMICACAQATEAAEAAAAAATGRVNPYAGPSGILSVGGDDANDAAAAHARDRNKVDTIHTCNVAVSLCMHTHACVQASHVIRVYPCIHACVQASLLFAAQLSMHVCICMHACRHHC